MNTFEYISISINYNRPRVLRELCMVAMAGASVEVTLLPWKYPECACVLSWQGASQIYKPVVQHCNFYCRMKDKKKTATFAFSGFTDMTKFRCGIDK